MIAHVMIAIDERTTGSGHGPASCGADFWRCAVRGIVRGRRL